MKNNISITLKIVALIISVVCAIVFVVVLFPYSLIIVVIPAWIALAHYLSNKRENAK